MSDFGELVEELKKRQEREEREGLLDTFVRNDAYYENLDSMVQTYKDMFAEKFPVITDEYERGAAAYYSIYGTKGEF